MSCMTKSLALCMGMSALSLAASSWDDFFNAHMKMMQSLHKEMSKNFDRFASKKNPFSISIEELPKDNKVVITIEGIKADSFDALLNDSNKILTITTEHEQMHNQIMVQIVKHTVGIEVTQKISKEEKTSTKDNDKTKDEKDFIYYESSTTSSARTVQEELHLENHAIDYLADENTLKITIPMRNKKAGKSVPVNIIKK